jgi:hypothetical protein
METATGGSERRICDQEAPALMILNLRIVSYLAQTRTMASVILESLSVQTELRMLIRNSLIRPPILS